MRPTFSLSLKFQSLPYHVICIRVKCHVKLNPKSHPIFAVMPSLTIFRLQNLRNCKHLFFRCTYHYTDQKRSGYHYHSQPAKQDCSHYRFSLSFSLPPLIPCLFIVYILISLPLLVIKGHIKR